MEDYMILKDYDRDTEWTEIFFFDHFLTNGDIERIEQMIDEIKDSNPDYSNEDIESGLADLIPYTKSIVLSSSDDYHTIWY
mgnify:CR=1 FL=1